MFNTSLIVGCGNKSSRDFSDFLHILFPDNELLAVFREQRFTFCFYEKLSRISMYTNMRCLVLKHRLTLRENTLFWNSPKWNTP